mmetsp:Transcript_43890/g.138300  ORF Transcript_43890/g.138300 Transcript_43890/m.138300 type:complete len:269 (-) Transcript_43890:27-833(-)
MQLERCNDARQRSAEQTRCETYPVLCISSFVHVVPLLDASAHKRLSARAALDARAAVSLAATHARVGQVQRHAEVCPEPDHLGLAELGLRQSDLDLGCDDVRERAEAVGEGARARRVPHGPRRLKLLVLAKIVTVEADGQLRAAERTRPRQREGEKDEVAMRHRHMQAVDGLKPAALGAKVELLRRRHALKAGADSPRRDPLSLRAALRVVGKERNRMAADGEELRNENCRFHAATAEQQRLLRANSHVLLSGGQLRLRGRQRVTSQP